MHRTVTDQNPYLLLGWAAEKLGFTHIWPPESRALGVVDEDGVIHAVVVYNAFYDGACHMHIASNHTRSWATRSVLTDLFSYPFDVLGLHRVNAQTAHDNIVALITNLKIGFRVEGVKASAFQNADGSYVDAVIFGMLSSECRYRAAASDVAAPEEAAMPVTAEVEPQPPTPLVDEDVVEAQEVMFVSVQRSMGGAKEEDALEDLLLNPIDDDTPIALELLATAQQFEEETPPASPPANDTFQEPEFG